MPGILPVDEEYIVIAPRKGKQEQDIPACGLFFATAADAGAAHQRLLAAGGQERSFFMSRLTVAASGDFFVAGPALGAPFATMCLENLIVLGARRMVFYGWCGSISEDLPIGQIVVGDAAISGEGTSQYYPLPEPARPADGLQKEIVSHCAACGLATQLASMWSTDALYREDRRQLAQLRQEKGVRAIDMEYSAMCAVAAFRQIELAGVFVVSDELFSSSWRPGFSRAEFRRAGASLLDAMLRFFTTRQ
jgi:purine-nucleoside phosphorylase